MKEQELSPEERRLQYEAYQATKQKAWDDHEKSQKIELGHKKDRRKVVIKKVKRKKKSKQRGGKR